VKGRLLQGDALERLRDLPDESVHCCITSPPYYGLRDYGTASWEGGDSDCDHLMPPAGSKSSGLGNYGNHMTPEVIEKIINVDRRMQYRDVCRRCGAKRIDQQIGLEQTPEEFVERLVGIFAEVKRVLRQDGTLWLNLGDSYARGAGDRKANYGRAAKGLVPPDGKDTRRQKGYAKEKDLLGIPWLVAFALRADGWYLRSEIIWHKPNPMPESVTDRPTNAHEKVFLFAKSARYYYDNEAIREDWTCDRDDMRTKGIRTGLGYLGTTGNLSNSETDAEFGAGARVNGETPTRRNKRNVWTITTKPFPDAHFATFPPDLVQPMVLAGASPQTCEECGAPWEREVEVAYENPGNRTTNGPRSEERKHQEHGTAGYKVRLERRSITTGWAPSCDHGQGGGRSTVLDPFAGSGTTLQVALELGRDAIGIELNPDYVGLAERRLSTVTPPLFPREALA
jgi:DNA modification methylase